MQWSFLTFRKRIRIQNTKKRNRSAKEKIVVCWGQCGCSKKEGQPLWVWTTISAESGLGQTNRKSSLSMAEKRQTSATCSLLCLPAIDPTSSKSKQPICFTSGKQWIFFGPVNNEQPEHIEEEDFFKLNPQRVLQICLSPGWVFKRVCAFEIIESFWGYVIILNSLLKFNLWQRGTKARHLPALASPIWWYSVWPCQKCLVNIFNQFEYVFCFLFFKLCIFN